MRGQPPHLRVPVRKQPRKAPNCAKQSPRQKGVPTLSALLSLTQPRLEARCSFDQLEVTPACMGVASASGHLGVSPDLRSDQWSTRSAFRTSGIAPLPCRVAQGVSGLARQRLSGLRPRAN